MTQPSTNRPPAVYVSPHCDDVCFSLGGYVAAHPQGTLLTVFTRSLFAPGAPGLPEAPEARTRAVSAVREAEDRAFAERCSLRRETLDFDEPGVRRRRPFDALVPDDVERIREPLLARLEELRARLPADARPELFVPLAIGGHVDHRAVLLCVLQDLTRLRSAFDLVFYEDLPYASRADARERALTELHAAARGAPPVREVHELGHDVALKLDLIALYPSQLLPGPVDIAGFTPATAECARPHEAWWRL